MNKDLLTLKEAEEILQYMDDEGVNEAYISRSVKGKLFMCTSYTESTASYIKREQVKFIISSRKHNILDLK